ncbi:hypothetical protein GW17_00011840 [Ensete ventricosum]|nr:hypothetical protein GW17_00011840 [Ensete ventricosum]
MRDYGRTDLGMRDRSPTAIGALHASHLEEGEKKRQRSDGSREETSMRTLVGMNAASFCAILKGDISAKSAEHTASDECGCIPSSMGDAEPMPCSLPVHSKVMSLRLPVNPTTTLCNPILYKCPRCLPAQLYLESRVPVGHRCSRLMLPSPASTVHEKNITVGLPTKEREVFSSAKEYQDCRLNEKGDPTRFLHDESLTMNRAGLCQIAGSGTADEDSANT